MTVSAGDDQVRIDVEGAGQDNFADVGLTGFGRCRFYLDAVPRKIMRNIRTWYVAMIAATGLFRVDDHHRYFFCCLE